MTTYKIIRMYFRDDIETRTIDTGLTLEEAQAHCNHPETSSSTCSTLAGLDHTRTYGPWFDGYTAEEDE